MGDGTRRLLAPSARAALAVTLAGGLVACRADTEIDVTISTNLACTEWGGTAVAVGELGPTLESKPPSTTSSFCDDAGFLGTVVAIPSGAETANVAFRIVGAVGQILDDCIADAGPGCIVARRALNFIPHETLSVAVPLWKKCEGVVCDPSSTCVQGQCWPATIQNPSQCESQSCGETALGAPEAGAPEGGGPTDAAADADATLPPSDAGPDADAADATLGPNDASEDGSQPIADAALAFDVMAPGCGTACAIAPGDGFTCAVREGGVWCWGQNFTGECGNGSEGTTNVIPGPANTLVAGVRGIVAGTDTSCAFVNDGAVACWGAGSPLGSDASDTVVPTDEPYLAGLSFVGIYNYHMCWGSSLGFQCTCAEGCQDENETSSMGDDAAAPSFSAALAPPPGEPPLAAFKSGDSFTCVLTAAGAVYCLGSNEANETDPGPSTSSGIFPSFTPLPFDGGPAQELSMRFQTACIRVSGSVFCWGAGAYGQNAAPPGPGYDISQVTYAQGGPLTDVVQLAAGASHFCALLADGRVACWGDNSLDQLGQGGTDGGSTYAALFVLDSSGGTFGGVAAIAAGTAHTCALKADRSLWCWGVNGDGESAPGNAASTVAFPAKVF